MIALALPQARIPLGYATVGGQRVPVEIDIEWMRALTVLVQRTGGVMGTDFAALISELAAAPLPQLPVMADDNLAPPSYPAQIAEQSPDSRVSALEAEVQKLQQQVDGLLQGYQV